MTYPSPSKDEAALSPELIAGEMRSSLKRLAKDMEDILNMMSTREMSLAKTQLESSIMWAEKAISKSIRLLDGKPLMNKY